MQPILITPAERVAVAQAIGVNEQYLYQCLTGRRTTPAERCPAIERASAGKVSCEALRRDVTWHRVPDDAWPWHPEGRPLIDVAKPLVAATSEVRDAA